MKKLIKKLEEAFYKKFKKIFDERNNIYLNELEKEKEKKQEEFHDKTQIIDRTKVKDNFKEKLFAYYKKEFFKLLKMKLQKIKMF